MEFQKVNKTMIPFALVAMDVRLVAANSALRWLFTISYPTRARKIIVKYSSILNSLVHVSISTSNISKGVDVN